MAAYSLSGICVLKYHNPLLVGDGYSHAGERSSAQSLRHLEGVTARLGQEIEILAFGIFECEAVAQVKKVSGHGPPVWCGSDHCLQPLKGRSERIGASAYVRGQSHARPRTSDSRHNRTHAPQAKPWDSRRQAAGIAWISLETFLKCAIASRAPVVLVNKSSSSS